MAKRYYKISFSPHPPEAWQLSAGFDQFGNEIDPGQFTEGKYYSGPQPTKVKILKSGPRIRFNFASFGLPVVETALLRKIKALATDEIVSYPVQVEDAGESYEVVNFLEVVDCLDYARSEYTLWSENDERVDKRGKLRMVSGLKIDPEKAYGHQIFRVRGWETSLIISEDVANILRQSANSGTTLQEVS